MIIDNLKPEEVEAQENLLKHLNAGLPETRQFTIDNWRRTGAVDAFRLKLDNRYQAFTIDHAKIEPRQAIKLMREYFGIYGTKSA